ncbi:MAG: DMT family transporter [Opitutales bacterium]|nr:DMT family transporter [Opitutales bacterium]NRA25710.1 DMT family transporter [Opitutales bacterium]
MTTPAQATESHESRGVILSLASIGCFSATALLLSYLNKAHGVDGWVSATYRGFLGLVAIAIMQNRAGKLALSHIITNRLLFLRGLIGGIAIPIFYICIIEIGAGRAGMITGSYPLFAAFFAMVFIKESVRWVYGIYIAIAFAGLVSIYFDQGIGGGEPFYDILAIFGAAAGGICVVLIRHLRHTENTSNIFASQCVFTLVISLAFAGDRIFITDPMALGLTVLAGIIVVGGQLCVTESFRYITVAKGSTLQMLTPATTCVFSALLLGESFGVFEIVGGFAILFASFQIVQMKAKG